MNVSVVIPAYNAEPFLYDCIRSTLAQTHPVKEVIVVDDGSTDRTREIAASFGGCVRLLQQQRGGPARARNLGSAQASGEWIACLDADDMWQPEKIAAQVSALKCDPQAILCYTGLLLLKPDGSSVPALPPDETYVDRTLRVANPGIPPSSVMLRREVLLQAGGFNEAHKGCEDWELWFRLRMIGRFCSVQQPVTIYREAPGSLSSNPDLMYNDFLQMLEPLLLADLHGARRWLWRRRIVSYQLYKAALTARHACKHEAECRYAIASLLSWPSPFWHPRRYATALITMRNCSRR